MTDTTKIQPTHRQRLAIIYLRQSTAHQLEYNRESTDRQYALVDRALELGWSREQISLVDDDLGLSGDGIAERCGFSSMPVQVTLGQVGIILGIEVSRLARNNAEWYRLLDLCAMTDKLIGDDDGLYRPAVFNDRLLLGLKGTMSIAFGLAIIARSCMAFRLSTRRRHPGVLISQLNGWPAGFRCQRLELRLLSR